MSTLNKARNERIVELAKTMGAAQIARVLKADYPEINRNKVIGVINRECPKDAGSKERRRIEGIRMNKEAQKVSRGGGNLGMAAPTAEQKARAQPKPRVAPPRPMSDPAMRPAPLPIKSGVLTIPVPGSAPVPYAERTGCVWPFGERSTMTACNRPKCKVRAYGVVQKTNYCDVHWDARRATKHTQIVA